MDAGGAAGAEAQPPRHHPRSWRSPSCAASSSAKARPACSSSSAPAGVRKKRLPTRPAARRRSPRSLFGTAERSVSAAAAGRGLHAVVRRDSSQRSEELIVLGVGADPEPHDDLALDDAQRAMSESDACGVNG